MGWADTRLESTMTTSEEGREERVRETARLLAQGMTNEQIAHSLGVHPRTVSDYVATLNGKETKQSRQRRRDGKASPNPG